MTMLPAARTRDGRSGKFVTPLMNISDRLVFAALVLMWLGAQVFFWSWWLQSAHTVTVVGMALNSVLLVWSLVLPAVFLLHLRRAARPNPAIPLPTLRVAMVVTKAPSEPWDVVRRTLSAMLCQDMPYAYDVWLADEAPEPETLRWCDANGIRVSTRQNRADYHRAEWPRRTRCKEGNLAFFYDHWGYSDYDVVAQLDADHRPSRTYLREMVRPFADPTVGYVAAPSICDLNAKASWSARGRLYKEATFHGPHQSGGHYAVPPMCIGSHYAVRTSALRQTGGIGPELAEDFSTSLMMNSFGWFGVFAPDAEAHGDGPETFADCITQEFQWARSLTAIALHYNSAYWKRLRFRAKLKLGYGEAWYTLQSCYMVAACLLPIVALATGTPWANVPLLSFFAHVFTIGFVMFLAAAWTRSRQWLRPRDARIVSWELALYTIAKWPWILWGVVHAVAGKVTGRHFAFKVTPKGIDTATPLALKAVIPYLIVAIASAVTAVLTAGAGRASGYYYFCLLNALMYTFVAIAILCLHLREASQISFREAWRLAPGATVATVLGGTVALASLVLRGRAAADTLLPPHDWGQVETVARQGLQFVVPTGRMDTAALLLIGAAVGAGLCCLWFTSPARAGRMRGRLVLRRVGHERHQPSIELNVPFDVAVDLARLIETLPSAVVIDWLGNGERSGFGLTMDDRAVGPLLTSPGSAEHDAPPSRTPETSRAHAILYDRLVSAGWEPYGRGGSWYNHRFRRVEPS